MPIHNMEKVADEAAVPAVVPYVNQVQHDMPSLARVLKEQGYETMAIHPQGCASFFVYCNDTDSISQYRMLQYNQLYVKKYQQNIFEETETRESEY